MGMACSWPHDIRKILPSWQDPSFICDLRFPGSETKELGKCIVVKPTGSNPLQDVRDHFDAHGIQILEEDKVNKKRIWVDVILHELVETANHVVQKVFIIGVMLWLIKR